MKLYVVLTTLFASLAWATPSVQSNSQGNELLSRQRGPVRPPGNCCSRTACDPSCVCSGKKFPKIWVYLLR
ncbi:hypothetical protein CSPAE12_07588 [Colletotrichum incanum]|nr:hypothetical protein CSPAE12_07588 [Colletotrichum incanum]